MAPSRTARLGAGALVLGMLAACGFTGVANGGAGGAGDGGAGNGNPA